MQYCTRNPSIKKPELSDASSIIDINDNMDVIDGIICKSNFNGATDPSVNDDVEDGYSVGSNWWNVTDHRLFVAESVATGAAVWRQIYRVPAGGIDHGTHEYVTDPIEIDHAASSPVSLGTAPAYSIVELITRCTENESGCVLTIGDEDDADSHCTDALMPVATTDAPVVTPLSPQYYATAKALRATITTTGTAGKWNVQFKIKLVG